MGDHDSELRNEIEAEGNEAGYAGGLFFFQLVPVLIVDEKIYQSQTSVHLCSKCNYSILNSYFMVICLIVLFNTFLH